MYGVFIKYCVSFEDFKILRTLAVLCSAELAEIAKNQNFKEKKTIINEHPVTSLYMIP